MARREGQVVARGPGRWLIRWPTGKDSGRYRVKSKTIHGTKRDADRELRGILLTRDRNEYIEPSKETLDAYLDRWLGSYSKQVSLRTASNVRTMLDKHVRPVLGTYNLQKLSTLAVQEMIDNMSERAKRPLSPRTHQLCRRHGARMARHFAAARQAIR